MGVWMRHCVAVTPVAPILDLTACMLSHPPMVRSWSSVTANRIFGQSLLQRLCTRDPAAAPAALARSGRQRAERVAGAAPAGASRRPWPWTLLLDPPAAGSGGTSGSAGCQPRHLAPPVANARNSEIGHVDRWSKFPLQCDSRLTGNLHLTFIAIHGRPPLGSTSHGTSHAGTEGAKFGTEAAAITTGARCRSNGKTCPSRWQSRPRGSISSPRQTHPR